MGIPDQPAKLPPSMIHFTFIEAKANSYFPGFNGRG
jgi:hypothetical protein